MLGEKGGESFWGRCTTSFDRLYSPAPWLKIGLVQKFISNCAKLTGYLIIRISVRIVLGLNLLQETVLTLHICDNSINTLESV